MLKNGFYKYVTNILSSVVQQEVKLLRVLPVSGGSINESFRLETNRGEFFIKINSASKYPKMFEKEALGLNLLRDTVYI